MMDIKISPNVKYQIQRLISEAGFSTASISEIFDSIEKTLLGNKFSLSAESYSSSSTNLDEAYSRLNYEVSTKWPKAALRIIAVSLVGYALAPALGTIAAVLVTVILALILIPSSIRDLSNMFSKALDDIFSINWL